jgi:hypothetical protein
LIQFGHGCRYARAECRATGVRGLARDRQARLSIEKVAA